MQRNVIQEMAAAIYSSDRIDFALTPTFPGLVLAFHLLKRPNQNRKSYG